MQKKAKPWTAGSEIKTSRGLDAKRERSGSNRLFSPRGTLASDDDGWAPRPRWRHTGEACLHRSLTKLKGGRGDCEAQRRREIMATTVGGGAAQGKDGERLRISPWRFSAEADVSGRR
jgi:hypothetical protein